MKILMVSSEMEPFARTGGLGDVLEALPEQLAKRGHEVSVVLPFYRSIRENASFKITKTGVVISVRIGSKKIDAEILTCKTKAGLQIFFVRCDEYFDRSGFYGVDGRAYADNAERFMYFSRAVVELARRISPTPDIIHCHDWQTALIPAMVREQNLPFKTVLTIHNMEFQGNFWGLDFALTKLPPGYFHSGFEFHGGVNFLKGGIVFANAITTVSERYAFEIQTSEYGCGLENVVREQAGKLRGILNGIDDAIWNPANDELIPQTFSAQSLAGKTVCREKLLANFGLEKAPAGPVFAMVSRLAEQKGIDLLLPLLDRLLAADVRLIILGEGEIAYERELTLASKKHPDRFAFRQGFDDRLSHEIVAGSDATLLPSHYEPCSLSAMYSLKYGSVPIARACGGLHQIIQDHDPATDSGSGFLFYDYTPAALWDCIGRARKIFANRQLWSSIVRRGMETNFSWENSAAQYEKIYARL